MKAPYVAPLRFSLWFPYKKTIRLFWYLSPGLFWLPGSFIFDRQDIDITLTSTEENPAEAIQDCLLSLYRRHIYLTQDGKGW